MKRMSRIALCAAGLHGMATLTAGEALAQGREPYQAKDRHNHEGPYFLLGAGTEGYTGALASAVEPGISYGVVVGYKPTHYFGVELGYSGAAHELDVRIAGTEPTGGMDVVRNGGQVAASLGFTETRLQPYVMGGLGFERYTVRAVRETGFQSDTNGYVPAGLGLRYKVGPVFTADARLTYNFPIGQDFGPVPTDDPHDSRYQGLLQLGASY